MINRRHRLALDSKVPFRGRRLQSRSFQIITKPSSTQFHLAIIISKKNVSLSTHRHRLKRFFASRFIPLLKTHSPLDCLILVSPSADKTRPPNLQAEIDQIAAQIFQNQA